MSRPFCGSGESTPIGASWLQASARTRDNSAMFRQSLTRLTVPTRGRGLLDITDSVRQRVSDAGIETGLCTLHLQHTSASLLIQENADPDVRGDFERFFARLVPDGDASFVHTVEGDDDMPAHIRTALTTVNLSVPVADGRLCLGTWQGIYLWEHRRAPHRRTVIVHLFGA
jgi:secondary thiamine-phosphate synthase enzyme